MGNSQDAIKAQQEEADEKAKEMMNVVHKMMIQKIAATASTMKNAAIEDKSLPITAVVDTVEKYKFKVTEAPSDKVSEGMDEVLSGKFLDGIKTLVSAALDEFLGNTSVGERERSDFHVVFGENSLLRLDYMFYKYQFSSKGLLKEQQNAFCYYMQVAVLDLTKVDPQVLLYELTKAIGEENLHEASKELKDLANFAKDLYATIHELGTAATSEEDTSKRTTSKSVVRYGGPPAFKQEEENPKESDDEEDSET